MVYADQRFVKSRSKCLGSAGTNPETACHAFVDAFSEVSSETHSPVTTENTYLVRA